MKSKKTNETPIITKKQKHPMKILLLILAGLILFVLLVLCISRLLRRSKTVPYNPSYEQGNTCPKTPYNEQEEIENAISYSYLVYGLEHSKSLTGSVNDLLDKNDMGIIIENFGIKRTDKANPATALLDTATYIRNKIGDSRLLISEKDDSSGFYGAAFCDDEKKCIWITYSGSVSTKDVLACAEFYFKPGLSRQEEYAFTLFQKVLESEEVSEENYQIILTGHSLGGLLSTMVSCASGYRAITINGADGVALDKYRGMNTSAVNTAAISNHMTSPENGQFSTMDLVQRLMFFGSHKDIDEHVYKANGKTTDSHCAFSFLNF